MAIKKKKAHKRLNRSGDIELVRANGEGTLIEAIAGLMDVVGASISDEQPLSNRARNDSPQEPQHIRSSGDTAGEARSITNMTSSAPLVTDLSRISDDRKGSLEKDGAELYSPINVKMYNETMCGTGAISTGALPMLFQPDYDGSGKGRKRKRRLKNKKHDGIRAMFTDNLDRSIQLMIEQMRVARQI